MKKITSVFIVTLFFGVLIHTSCKKSTGGDPSNLGTDFTQFSSDENLLHTASEALLDDITTVMENSSLGKVYPISGATVNDSDFINLKRIIINYNGDNASGSRTRKGTVIIELIEGEKWSDSASVIQITSTRVTITHKITGNSLEYSGVYYVRNVSGGKIFVSNEVVHKFWGTGTMIFDNSGDERIWNINRKRTFNIGAGFNTITTLGDTSLNGVDGVIEWGFTRKAVSFQTQVIEPIIFRTNCATGPYSGIKNHKGMLKEVKVTFGVDEQGEPVSFGCPYGYKVNWSNNADSLRTAIVAY
ncbi:MAG: hypothetical protein WC760_11960 [Bacteroidia bacterium]|jgi:hypothetical protein